MSKELTQEHLQNIIHYNQRTGVFKYLVELSNGLSAGDRAGSSKGSAGYESIKIDGVQYLSHRLAFLYMTGEFPKQFVDHIDMVKTHNWWSNLRDVSRSENGQNKIKPQSNNKTGYLGVSYRKDIGKYIACIGLNGKKKYLGRFTNAVDAHNAYIEAKRDMHTASTI